MTESNTHEACRYFVSTMKQAIKRQYSRNINRDLSQHNLQQLFKRNVTESLQQGYKDTVVYLNQLDMTEQALPSLAMLLAAFEGYIDEVIEHALQHHRTSCALSNFADEHKPSKDYISEVLHAAHHDWQKFNQHLASELIG